MDGQAAAAAMVLMMRRWLPGHGLSDRHTLDLNWSNKVRRDTISDIYSSVN